MAGQLRFISVAGRELRVIARRKRTYLIRWGSVAVFFLFLVWLIWVLDGFRRAGVGSDIFQAFAAVVFFHCLIVGTAQTADCISSEKRGGTLGLLFLTNLNSAEIVAGKLCSTALPTVYGLLAIFPLLGIPMLMGGVTVGEFWRTMLALLDAIVFALSCGFVASVVCKRQFAAIALALALAIGVGTGLLAAAAIVAEFPFSKKLVDGLSVFSPLYTLISADGGRAIGRPNHYWQSLGAVAGMSLLGLGFVTWRLSHVWQDRPKAARVAWGFNVGQRWRQLGANGRAAFRRRLLDINPFYWLAGQSRVSSPVFMIVVLGVTLITVFVTAPYFASVVPGGGAMKPVFGSLIAWLITGLLIHVLTLYYAAMISSQRLAEDKHTGALELILSTPTTERDISRGLWLAFFRRMAFPALAVVCVHFYFIAQGMNAMVMDSQDLRIPRDTGAWELFWALLTGSSLGGHSIQWGLGFMLQIALLFLVMAVVIWFTLGLVGRWLGLRMKLAGFAPLISLALVFIPPVILFSVFAYVAYEFRLMPSNDKLQSSILLWTGFSMGVLHCILLSAWASARLHEQFRDTVIGQAASTRGNWLPSARMMLRVAGGSAAYIVALAIVLTGISGCRNYQSGRTWKTFQSRLQQKGESLDLAPLMPVPVADKDNFAVSQAFVDVRTDWNKPFQELMNHVHPLDAGGMGESKNTFSWVNQERAPLREFAGWLKGGSFPHDPTNNAQNAGAILTTFAPHTNVMHSLAVAARLPLLQLTTNRNVDAILRDPGAYMTKIERLHFLFTLRATASVESGLASQAADDFLTSLEFVRLLRQSPDMKSARRTQVLLTRSIQPLWEGLREHRWTENQLAEFERALSQFNLLPDFTNNVRRTALVYIQTWKAVADSNGRIRSIPDWNGGNTSSSSWPTSPGQWRECCIQLHQLAADVIAEVDMTNERVELDDSWRSLHELPLDSEAQGLFGQYYWQGFNPTFVGYAQTALNQARFAIALERFRIANGKYPATANELVPAFLTRIPRDSMRGTPLIYQRLDDDHFILRGTGPNRKDDRNTPTSSDDWLWAFPTNAVKEAKSP